MTQKFPCHKLFQRINDTKAKKALIYKKEYLHSF